VSAYKARERSRCAVDAHYRGKERAPSKPVHLVPPQSVVAVSKPQPSYKEYLLSEEWQAKRLAVFERDGNRCRLCNSARGLQAHHRHYKNIFHEEIEDLTTLCHACHERYSKDHKAKTKKKYKNKNLRRRRK